MKLALLLWLSAGAVPPGPEPPVYPGVGAALKPPVVREASVLRTQAIDHFRQGLLREAAQEFRVEASSAAEDSEAWRDAMWAHWYAGEYVRAREAGHELTRLLPKDLEGLNLTARSHLFAGEREAALKDYLRSLDVDATQLAPRRAASRLYEWFREYRRAIRYAQWALEDAPDDAASYALIGRARFLLGEFGASAKAWRAAVERSRGNRDYRLSLAQALYFSGEEEKALHVVRELLDDDPRFWGAVDFHVNVMLVRRDLPGAVSTLERALSRITPKDEPRLMFLARLYALQKRDYAFEAAVESALALNPDNGAALLALGSHLARQGRGKEAALFYERVLDLNPGSEQAWVGLADALAISSRPAQALEAVRHARALDPTDPHLLVLETRYMFVAGQRAESKKMLLSWLAENQDSVLPVILYHGITPFATDPLLAQPVHITTGTFEDHIRALAEKGFKPITAEQAAAWFRRQMDLPPSAVLVTFDDGRIDSVRYADPILRKYNFRATMYAPLHKLDLNDHFYVSWKDLAKMRATKRWDVQAHGDWAHTYVEVDREGRSGLAISNRKRGETEDQFITRISADHERAKARLETKIGRLPSTYAFPDGDFGQLGIPNFPDSAELNLKLCRQSFDVCFHQASPGINTRTRDPAQATRVEARGDWKGADLVELIGDEDPRVLVRRQLIMRAIYDRRAREALRWLDENKHSGASDALNLSDEGRIRFSFGDRPRGLGMARAALRLDDEDEYRKLVDELERKMRPQLQPGARLMSDNRDRRHFTGETAYSNMVVGYSMLKPMVVYGQWRETDFPTVVGQGVGLEAARHLSLFHVLTVRGTGYKLAESSRKPFTASAAVRSNWTDPFFTELEGGSQDMLTARAVTVGIREQFGVFSAGARAVDSWEAKVRARGGRLTDDNKRFQGTLRVSRPIADLEGLRAVMVGAIEGAAKRSVSYYSPQRLLTGQLGLSYQPELSDWLGLEVSYLPGYGYESGVPQGGANTPDVPATRVVHLFTASVTAHWGQLSAKPLLTLSRTPLYRSDTYGLNLGWQF